MTVEEAKRRLLNPPAEPEGPSWVQEHAVWLALGAFSAGMAIARPVRLGGIAGKVVTILRSSLARRIGSTIATSLKKGMSFSS